MASFLSPIQKATIDSALDRLHDTFAGDIYAYVESVADETADVNYNALYENTKSAKKTPYSKIMTRHTISARVKYIGSQLEALSQANLKNSSGQVRIKVLPADYEIIKISSKIEIDQVFYIVDGDAAVEGIFSNNYYSVYLKREN